MECDGFETNEAGGFLETAEFTQCQSSFTTQQRNTVSDNLNIKTFIGEGILQMQKRNVLLQQIPTHAAYFSARLFIFQLEPGGTHIDVKKINDTTNG